jgi:excisionase family DNA binding protein
VQFLTVNQAAEEADVHEATIRRWIGDGLLKSTRLGPRAIAISPEDLEKTLESRKGWTNGQSRGHSWFNTPINAKKKQKPQSKSTMARVHFRATMMQQRRMAHIREKFPDPVPPGTIKEYCLNHLMVLKYKGE